MGSVSLGSSTAGRMVETVRQFGLATVFLTRLPLPRILVSQERLRHTVWAFPLIGAGIGLLAGLVAYIAYHVLGLPAQLTAIFTILASVLMTGALHEDGFTDTCDAMTITDPETRHEVMHDSRVGAYGVIGLLVLFLLKWQLYSYLALFESVEFLIYGCVMAAALSRWAMVATMAITSYAPPSDESMAGLAIAAGRPSVWATVLATLLVALIVLWAGISVASSFHLVILFGFVLVLRLKLRQWGGANGDTFGFSQQVAECITLLAIIFVEPPLGAEIYRILEHLDGIGGVGGLTLLVLGN